MSDKKTRQLERLAAAGDPEAQERLEREKERLLTTYVMVEGDGQWEEEVMAANMKEALDAAEEWTKGGDYNEPESTIWVDVGVRTLETDEDGDPLEADERRSIAIHPREPDCRRSWNQHDEHEWHEGSPHGSGGGVMGRDRCLHCGLVKEWDTWAQRQDTGEQGLFGIAYAQDRMEDEELEALRARVEACHFCGSLADINHADDGRIYWRKSFVYRRTRKDLRILARPVLRANRVSISLPAAKLPHHLGMTVDGLLEVVPPPLVSACALLVEHHSLVDSLVTPAPLLHAAVGEP